MEEREFGERLMKAFLIIGWFTVIFIPTAVNIAIFFSVLSLNADLAAQRADNQAQRLKLRAVYSEFQAIRSDLRDVDDDVDALSADGVELKIGYAAISARLDSIGARLAAAERRLPDAEYAVDWFAELEREHARLRERVDALYAAAE